MTPLQGAPIQAPDESVEAVVRAASGYVEAYRKDVAFLLADEHYTQTRTRAGRKIDRRVMTGDFFLTFLEADRKWIAVHDVVTVDGRDVPDRDSLQTLLRKGGSLRGIVEQVAQRNAEFNIGSVWRNFNEPTFALMLLDPDRTSSVTFRKKQVERGGEATLVTLTFEEDDRPTLVRGPGGPVAGRGELIIEAGTGRVRQTRFELEQGDLSARLVTEYAYDAHVEMWLPSRFTERYENRAGVSPEPELIVCEADYTNYRRFTATGRIKR